MSQEFYKENSNLPIVLVLGASGLIGHTISKYLSNKCKVFSVLRKDEFLFEKNCLILEEINIWSLKEIFFELEPDYVINCIGLTKHLADPLSNRFFIPNIIIPRYLKILRSEFKFRLIHVSSDCVFNGKIGNYEESSMPDAADFYGLTKAISESDLENCSMILRTSTVGYELNSTNGIIEWFLSSKKRVYGYSQAFFNGVTTLELAKVIWEIVSNKINYQYGIFHVTGNTISKYDFLLLLNEIHNTKKNIQKDVVFCIDRTLSASQKIKALDRSKKSWQKMLMEMKEYRENEICK